MLSFLKKKKAQSIAEYALMLAVVILAFMVLQIFLREKVEGWIVGGTDRIPTIMGQKANATDTVESLFGGSVDLGGVKVPSELAGRLSTEAAAPVANQTQ